jgi:hypothetical protein
VTTRRAMVWVLVMGAGTVGLVVAMARTHTALNRPPTKMERYMKTVLVTPPAIGKTAPLTLCRQAEYRSVAECEQARERRIASARQSVMTAPNTIAAMVYRAEAQRYEDGGCLSADDLTPRLPRLPTKGKAGE